MWRRQGMTHDETIVEILWALTVPAIVIGFTVVGGRFLLVELREAGVAPSAPEFPLGPATVALCVLVTMCLLLNSRRRLRHRSSPP